MRVGWTDYSGAKKTEDIVKVLKDAMDGWSGEGGALEFVEGNVSRLQDFLADIVSMLIDKKLLEVSDMRLLTGRSDLEEVRENDILD